MRIINKTAKKQQYRFMLYNFIAFSIIFTLFAAIIYLQISNSLFDPVVKDMETAKQSINSSQEFIDRQLNYSPPDMYFDDKSGKGKLQNEGKDMFDTPPGDRFYFPFRVEAVIRDEGGAVLNPHALGKLHWDELLEDIPFSTENLDVVESFKLDDLSAFKSLSFLVDYGNGDTYYIQLVANVDSEQAMIDNILKYLVICVILSIVASIFASYVLSKKLMAPIIKSWNRQREFVENASHELRTPLTIIQNKAENLFTTPSATIMDKADDIGVVLGESRRLSKLTSDLMTLARADSNETQLEKEQFDLNELITDMSQPYAEMAELQNKSLSLNLDNDISIIADKSRIHQLMVILLDNALKYTKENNDISINTKSREDKIIIEVCDNGIGISDQQKEQLFKRFYRAENDRSRESGGSGLGLSIAQWIVGEHGGSIRIYQNSNDETVVEVIIPRA